jgi:hypothetical protein
VLTEAGTVSAFFEDILGQQLFMKLSERGVKHFCTCLSGAAFFTQKNATRLSFLQPKYIIVIVRVGALLAI